MQCTHHENGQPSHLMVEIPGEKDSDIALVTDLREFKVFRALKRARMSGF